MEKPEHIVRMESELEELEIRTGKAADFLGSSGIHNLNRMQITLLNIQVDAMRMYARVLKARIEHDIQVDHDKAVADADAPES